MHGEARGERGGARRARGVKGGPRHLLGVKHAQDEGLVVRETAGGGRFGAV